MESNAILRLLGVDKMNELDFSDGMWAIQELDYNKKYLKVV